MSVNVTPAPDSNSITKTQDDKKLNNFGQPLYDL